MTITTSTPTAPRRRHALALLLALAPGGCFDPGMQGLDGETDAAAETDGDTEYEPVILSAVVAEEHMPIPRVGDLWMSTWAADDSLYVTWGDGTGRTGCLPSSDGERPDFEATEDPAGCFDVVEPDCECGGEPCCEWQELVCNQVSCYEECLPLCPVTDAGLLRLQGEVPFFDACDGGNDCVVGLHLPARDLPEYYPVPQPPPGKNDKPSSILAVDDRLIFAGHRPPGEPNYGYLAYSTDKGTTWTEVQESPWGEDSHFRVAMLMNMGRGYELNEDGYIYVYGVPYEAWSSVVDVHLARVARDEVLDYDAYAYYGGLDDGEPIWADTEDDAVPVPGLETMEQSSAIYHEGIGRYLFLASIVDPRPPNRGALYEAPAPWGPWVEVAEVMTPLENPTWLGGQYVAGLITKSAGPTSVHFTTAGGLESYNLTIGRIDFTIRD